MAQLQGGTTIGGYLALHSGIESTLCVNDSNCLGGQPASYYGTSSLTLGTTSATAYRGDCGLAAYNHSTDNSQAHSDYLINNGDDSTTGILTASAFRTPAGSTDFNVFVRTGGGDALYVQQGDTTNDIATFQKGSTTYGGGTDVMRVKTDGVDVTGDLDVTGNGEFSESVYIHSSNTAGHWLMVTDTNSVNYSGLWSTNDDIRLILRDNDGNINVDLYPDGNSYINGGNVGIGTTSPSAKLAVYEAVETSTAITRVQSGNRGIDIISPSTSGYYGRINISGTNSDLRLGVRDYPDSIHIAGTTGNVGIGTTNPNSKLEIAKGGNEGIVIKDTQAYSNIDLPKLVGHSTFSIQGLRSGSVSGFFIGNYDGDTTILQGAKNDGSAGNNLLINPYGGNVGIGTTIPAYKLEVDGTARIDNTFTVGPASGNNAVLASWAGTNDGIIQLYSGTSVKTKLMSNGDSYFNGGNVGIGTATPTAGYKLDVVGDTYVQGDLKVSGGIKLHTQYISEGKYSASAGILVTTDIAVTDGIMIELYIEGNSYSQWGIIDGRVQAYNYPTNGTIIETSYVTHGIAPSSVRVFHHDGVVKFWMEQSGNYQTFRFRLGTNSGSNKITSITNSALPTAGITNEVIISPKTVFSSDVAIGSAEPTAGYKLDVVGDAKVRDNLDVTGELTIDYDIDAESQLLLKNDSAGTSAGAKFVIASNGNNFQMISYADNHATKANENWIFTSAGGSDVILGAGGVDSLRATSAGNIEIGGDLDVTGDGYFGGNIELSNAATRTIYVDPKTSAGAGTALNIFGGDALGTTSTIYNGGQLLMCAGDGGYTDIDYGGYAGVGGPMKICGGIGGINSGTYGYGGAGGEALISGGIGGEGEYGYGGCGGNTFICGGAGGYGYYQGGTGGNVCIVAGNAGSGYLYGNGYLGNMYTYGLHNYVCGTSTARMQVGTNLAVYATSTVVYLRYSNNIKLQTLSNGVCVTGCGFATDWIASSDIRIKKNITPITSALSKVDALCGVCYNLCEDNTPDMGLIAQDVLCIEPRLVSKSEPSEDDREKYKITDEKYGLKYDKFAGLFVEAIKELKEQNQCLQIQIESLRKEIRK